MKNKYFSILLLFLFGISLSNCSNSAEPTKSDKVNSDNFEISGEPITLDINVNLDSLQTENSPTFSIDYSALKLIGADLSYLKYYYPVPYRNNDVDREFIMAISDSFEVEMKNCKNGNEWLIDLGNIESNEDRTWINSEVAILKTENIMNTDSTINYKFTFKALKEGKGYISFKERNSLGVISSNDSHGLIIGYSINALNKILLNVDEIKWKYNIADRTFSTVSVYLKGTTNVYRLRASTYGDGVLMAMEIPIQDDKSFEIEIPVAFSHIA